MPQHDSTTESLDATGDSAPLAGGDHMLDVEEGVGRDDTAAPAELGGESPEIRQIHGGPIRRSRWSRILAFGVLPGLALVIACVAGYLKWEVATAHETAVARQQSSEAAKQSTIAILSYDPVTARGGLEAARALLTGTFQDSYSKLTNDVVIPAAEQKKITAVASVPAVASVSANPTHAVALVFVNQRITIGAEAPADTASAVRVTLDKVDGRWLVAGFDPV